MSRHRTGQAIVEVLILTPVLVVLVAAFTVVVGRVAATARLESAAQLAMAADAAGEPVQAAVRGRAKTVTVEAHRLVITVSAPLGDLTTTVPRLMR
ncbi:MAG: hypothetical protein NTZ81_10715 [Actinobacteria bacterium]|nr:hypothetical protein [Actinomycetota bacterium]